MSSTKIVIIVLILVAVIFAVFVLTGAFSSESKQDPKQAAQDFRNNPPAWTKTIKSFIGSRQPKIALKRPRYTSTTEEEIRPDNENPFRTAKFKRRMGQPVIEYDDNTEDLPEDMKDLKEQSCGSKEFNEDKNDECSIVALKGGGTFKFRCEGNAPCQVDVVK